MKYIVVNNHDGDEGSDYSLEKPITHHAPESPARIAGNWNIKCTMCKHYLWNGSQVIFNDAFEKNHSTCLKRKKNISAGFALTVSYFLAV